MENKFELYDDLIKCVLNYHEVDEIIYLIRNEISSDLSSREWFKILKRSLMYYDLNQYLIESIQSDLKPIDFFIKKYTELGGIVSESIKYTDDILYLVIKSVEKDNIDLFVFFFNHLLNKSSNIMDLYYITEESIKMRNMKVIDYLVENNYINDIENLVYSLSYYGNENALLYGYYLDTALLGAVEGRQFNLVKTYISGGARISHNELNNIDTSESIRNYIFNKLY